MLKGNLKRSFTLFDLIMIGTGLVVGSGVLIVTGEVQGQLAGYVQGMACVLRLCSSVIWVCYLQVGNISWICIDWNSSIGGCSLLCRIF